MDPTTHAFDREEVMAYLDGELAPERAAAAAAHLEQCAECRELAATLRSLSRQLPQWEVQAIPATVEQNVLRAAKEKPAETVVPKMDRPGPTRRPVHWLLWGAGVSVAALFLIAISIPTLYRSRDAANEAMLAEREKSAPESATRTKKQLAAPNPSATTSELSDYRAQRVAPAAPGTKGKLQASPNSSSQAQPSQPGPMIVRTASLTVLTKEFDSARAALEILVKAHQGYFGQFNVAAPASQGRSLTATVRVPAGQLDGVLAEIRKLGKVEQENQSADDVTRQYVDLTARLANARETEKRLVEILRERTGKVSDVLEVEEQIAATREQIERMDAERKNLDSQVRYAAVDLRITEEYKQSIETPAPSLGTRVNNAAVEGFRDAAELVLGLALWLLSTGPTLVVLGLLLGWPAWRLVRWVRRRFFPAAAAVSQ